MSTMVMLGESTSRKVPRAATSPRPATSRRRPKRSASKPLIRAAIRVLTPTTSIRLPVAAAGSGSLQHVAQKVLGKGLDAAHRRQEEQPVDDPPDVGRVLPRPLADAHPGAPVDAQDDGPGHGHQPGQGHGRPAAASRCPPAPCPRSPPGAPKSAGDHHEDGGERSVRSQRRPHRGRPASRAARCSRTGRVSSMPTKSAAMTVRMARPGVVLDVARDGQAHQDDGQQLEGGLDAAGLAAVLLRAPRRG